MSNLELTRQMDDLRGERQQVLRLAKERITGRVDAMKREAGLVVAETKRRLGADQVHLMIPPRQRLGQLRRHDAAAAHRRVTDQCDIHDARKAQGSRLGSPQKSVA